MLLGIDVDLYKKIEEATDHDSRKKAFIDLDNKKLTETSEIISRWYIFFSTVGALVFLSIYEYYRCYWKI